MDPITTNPISYLPSPHSRPPPSLPYAHRALSRSLRHTTATLAPSIGERPRTIATPPDTACPHALRWRRPLALHAWADEDDGVTPRTSGSCSSCCRGSNSCRCSARPQSASPAMMAAALRCKRLPLPLALVPALHPPSHELCPCAAAGEEEDAGLLEHFVYSMSTLGFFRTQLFVFSQSAFRIKPVLTF